ncbi:unnamed protein product (macronuclear) [Paramecium tetraurelia]|uniref:Uncharacterized protein n=1 Tax=Paramecium tetraurelia TaxID=5888 RepID=A0EDG3_PARTE|nr:uncharacterized protein GSPATT00004199001 [Paramecium tetraurelia]CAK93330.1 unnamed protein product [Paramecium tetraurelia]|eukprot:XP_001460727.1 hypothetical protein (macronuclear) [Paramecium tetraurelia strain d4-2]
MNNQISKEGDQGLLESMAEGDPQNEESSFIQQEHQYNSHQSIKKNKITCNSEEDVISKISHMRLNPINKSIQKQSKSRRDGVHTQNLHNRKSDIFQYVEESNFNYPLQYEEGEFNVIQTD